MGTRKIGTVKGVGTFEDRFECDQFRKGRRYVREREDPDSNYMLYSNNKNLPIKDPVERREMTELCSVLFD